MSNYRGHGYEHDHGDLVKAGRSRLLIAVSITGTFLVIEVAGAVLTHSLALLADAGHMATDVAALCLALTASWLARQPHSLGRSYGNMRMEILAALANGTALLAMAVYIMVEAAQRLGDPPAVDSGPMLAVAALGLAANAVCARVLLGHHGHRDDLNFRAALLHVLSDALGSLGALIGAALMLAFGWYIADPLIGIGIALLMMLTAIRLVWAATHVLLEGTPEDVPMSDLQQALLEQPGVVQVHDLHAWTLTSGYNAVTAHIVVDNNTSVAGREKVLSDLRQLIPVRFSVRHVTFQLEESADHCEEAHVPAARHE